MNTRKKTPKAIYEQINRITSYLNGIWASSKADTRRFVNAIIAGIEKNYFSYEDKYMDIAKQIESLREDAKTDCITFYSLLQSKLIYGSIELADIQ